MIPVRLLVSVRNARESLAALEGKADIIDVKEPGRGSLGRADDAAIAEVVAAVAGRRPISVALGELADHQESRVGQRRLPAEIKFAKIGLASAPENWAGRLMACFESEPEIGRIAVAYADHARAQSPSVDQVLAWALQHHAAGLLIDTFRKDGTSLFEWIDGNKLGGVIGEARSAGMMVALAGSLKGESFCRALALRPNVVAVRGAACYGDDRQGEVKAERVRALVNMIARESIEPAMRC